MPKDTFYLQIIPGLSREDRKTFNLWLPFGLMRYCTLPAWEPHSVLFVQSWLNSPGHKRHHLWTPYCWPIDLLNCALPQECHFGDDFYIGSLQFWEHLVLFQATQGDCSFCYEELSRKGSILGGFIGWLTNNCVPVVLLYPILISVGM